MFFHPTILYVNAASELGRGLFFQTAIVFKNASFGFAFLLFSFVVLFAFYRLFGAVKNCSSGGSVSVDAFFEASHLPDIMCFKLWRDNSGRFTIIRSSKSSEEAFRLAEGDGVFDAISVWNNVWEADKPKIIEAYSQIQELNGAFDLEVRVNDVMGSMRWLHLYVYFRQQKQGVLLSCVAQDISEKKDVQSRLIEEQKQLKTLYASIDHSILVLDVEGKVLDCNAAVEHCLGFRPDELIGSSLFDFAVEAQEDTLQESMACLKTDAKASCSLFLQTKDRGNGFFEMNLFCGTFENQHVIYGALSPIDICEEQHDLSIESKEMFEQVVNNIPFSIFWIDRFSVYLGCNQSFAKEMNLASSQDVVGKTVKELFDEQTALTIMDRNHQVIVSNRSQLNYSQPYPCENGSLGWREASEVPLHDAQGNPVAVLGVWKDVTEKNRADEQLKRTVEDMERFNQLMRGRERRTLELKAEVNYLLEELGRGKKYRTTSKKFNEQQYFQF